MTIRGTCPKCGRSCIKEPDEKYRIDIDSGGGGLKKVTVGYWLVCDVCGRSGYENKYSW
jgi:hypothetical protein